MPSPRNASAFSSFTTICSGVCFENFLMVIHSARPQAAGTTQNNPLKTNGPKNPDPSTTTTHTSASITRNSLATKPYTTQKQQALLHIPKNGNDGYLLLRQWANAVTHPINDTNRQNFPAAAREDFFSDAVTTRASQQQRIPRTDRNTDSSFFTMSHFAL